MAYQEQPVVTTETLALGYGTRVTNIRTNLDANRQRFIESIHLYTVSGRELADLRVSNPDEKLSDITQLLTLRAEKGSVDRP
ncbi:ORF6N domain-containing protein [Rosenbergiella epipactidis]|uniref:ORF6N domain-containing protein n=1 Tax=Rosenbergiella epipactidis TaxID=1544694 RepID=UPI001F4EBD7C|nr:ORF6N domain-containing protein [Rosenbergiella epipactidis]